MSFEPNTDITDAPQLLKAAVNDFMHHHPSAEVLHYDRREAGPMGSRRVEHTIYLASSIQFTTFSYPEYMDNVDRGWRVYRNSLYDRDIQRFVVLSPALRTFVNSPERD